MTFRFILILFLFSPTWSSAQFPEKNVPKDTTTTLTKVYKSVSVIPNFEWRYQRALHQVRKVYPIALASARIIDSLNMILEDTHRKGKRNRIERRTNKKLKQEFRFIIKDLYQSEGRVLTKLVYRETGLTVRQILNKYRGNFTGFMYSTMAGFFNQNLDAVYQPDDNTNDFIIECVIQDIKHGKVAFDPHVDRMSKSEYKTSMNEYHHSKKENRKKARKQKRKARQNKK